MSAEEIKKEEDSIVFSKVDEQTPDKQDGPNESV
jgi:hypothetical protein